MGRLHPIDGVVIVVYLVGITALGTWMVRRVHTLTDYFMPRRFGKGVMVMHAFGTGTASDQAVVVASATFQSGLSGIWFQWLWLFCTPFYWLIAAMMRRFRAVTTADVLQLRYGPSVAMLFSVVGIVGMSVKIGLMLKGSGALIESGTGGLIDARVAIPIITLMFVGYGAAGGLGAAIVTDFVQGLLTIVFSVILLPFVMSAVGGMAGIRENIPDPSMLSLVAPKEIGIFFILMMAVQALIGIIAQPYIMGVCGAGRTEMDGRFGFMVGNFVKRFCTIAWCLTAVAAVVWYGKRGIDPATIDPDSVYGAMAREFLPRAMPGLLGVFLASLLAGIMSSCDSFMVSASALFTENIYRPLVPRRSMRHYVWIARATGAAVVLGGLLFAYWVPSVVAALKIWFRIAPMVGIAFWLAIFWRRATAAGAWAAAAVGFACWWLTAQPLFVQLVMRLPWADRLALVWRDTGGKAAPEIYEPWMILFYTGMATLAAVVVSLLTKPVDPQRLDRFYSLMWTPIGPHEHIERPCTLPKGVEPADRPMLCTGWGLQIPRPSRTSVLGFLAGWVLVVLLIGLFVAAVRG